MNVDYDTQYNTKTSVKVEEKTRWIIQLDIDYIIDYIKKNKTVIFFSLYWICSICFPIKLILAINKINSEISSNKNAVTSRGFLGLLAVSAFIFIFEGIIFGILNINLILKCQRKKKDLLDIKEIFYIIGFFWLLRFIWINIIFAVPYVIDTSFVDFSHFIFFIFNFLGYYSGYFVLKHLYAVTKNIDKEFKIL
jgi:hypothetical protein